MIGWLPFGFATDFRFVSPDLPTLLLVLLAGVLSQLGLLFMFRALRRGEVTRVLSVIGAITPLVTFVLAFGFLGERLGFQGNLALLLLVGGVVTLTLEPSKFHRHALSSWLPDALVAAGLFALQAVIAKEVFNNYHFISAFALMSLGGLLYAAVLVASLPPVRIALAATFAVRSHRLNRSQTQIIWIIGNTALGGIAIILVNLAIKLGSPTLVNAFRSVQYSLVFIIALGLARKHPQLLAEQLSEKTITEKVLGIVLVMVGVTLLALT